ncbi:MAG: hypothetical protein NTW19_21920 [Planctomycetota bacterium]|nr:hypothetical protein [Planctomycetota bacterium]
MNSAANPSLLPPPTSGNPETTVPRAALIPALEPKRVGHLLLIDSVAATVVWVGIVLVLVLGWAWSDLAPALWLAVTALVFVLVFLTDYHTRSAWQQLPMITAMVAQDPAGAEERLTALFRKAPMRRAIRVLLCHRLALLRYRQQRFAEVAGLCQAVLAHPLGQIRQVRSDLLLMMVDAQLQRGELAGAYAGLAELGQAGLNFPEQLQREAMQIRYAVAAAHYESALQDVQRKIAHVELLPAPQAADVHRVLAIAARRTGRARLAAWLDERGQLLGGPSRAWSA